MDKEQQTGWLLVLMTAILVGVVAFGAIYVNLRAEHFVKESEQRDCASLLSDIQAYEETPPTTRTGLGQWESKVGRYQQIGCSPELTAKQRTIPSPQPTR